MLAEDLAGQITGWHTQAARPLIIGLSGPQGSGKSTLCARLTTILAAQGLAAATLSLDDVYLTQTERQHLARTIHPLLATRGVPGTHDLALAHATLDALRSGPAAIPRFDKPTDDRAPANTSPRTTGPSQIILLEGWCLAAHPAPDPAPINSLEATEDPHGVWRAHINTQLTGPYQSLWARLDRLILLQAPDWPTIVKWRTEQETRSNARTMDTAQLARFMMHYERLTKAMLAHPPKADLTIPLDEHRTPR